MVAILKKDFPCMNDKKIATVISPFLLLCTAGIWGFAFVAQSVASELGAFTVVAVRNCFAASIPN